MLHPGFQIFVRKAGKETETTKETTIKRDFMSIAQFMSIASSIKQNPKIHLCVACFPLNNGIQCFYFHTLDRNCSSGIKPARISVEPFYSVERFTDAASSSRLPRVPQLGDHPCGSGGTINVLLHMVNVNHWPTADKAPPGPPSYLRCAALGAAEVSFMLTRLCLCNSSVIQSCLDLWAWFPMSLSIAKRYD